MSTRIVQTPLGAMRLIEAEGKLRMAVFTEACDEGEWEESSLLDKAVTQLGDYFSGKKQSFDLPLALSGTPFEMSVFQALLEIPYGQTRTYGQLAAQLGKPGAARAVGRACRRNPLHVFVPCHRVIGSDGSLTGFAAGVERKRALLHLEKQSGETL